MCNPSGWSLLYRMLLAFNKSQVNLVSIKNVVVILDIQTKHYVLTKIHESAMW
uniref:Uncharacterized protein n=1 Tax=Arundo donax TaxID=35708 RepID=A0A0A9CAK0_ARUDO